MRSYRYARHTRSLQLAASIAIQLSDDSNPYSQSLYNCMRKLQLLLYTVILVKQYVLSCSTVKRLRSSVRVCLNVVITIIIKYVTAQYD